MLDKCTKSLCFFIIASLLMSSMTWAKSGCNCSINAIKSNENQTSCCKTNTSSVDEIKSCNHCLNKKNEKTCNCEGNCKCEKLNKSHNPISELPNEFTNIEVAQKIIRLPIQYCILNFQISNMEDFSINLKENLTKLSPQQTFPLRV